MPSNFDFPISVLLFFYILIIFFILIFFVVSILCAVSFYDFFQKQQILYLFRECQRYLEIEQRYDLYQKCVELSGVH